jgi:DNA-binding CsgD family transcriptional regulator
VAIDRSLMRRARRRLLELDADAEDPLELLATAGALLHTVLSAEQSCLVSVDPVSGLSTGELFAERYSFGPAAPAIIRRLTRAAADEDPLPSSWRRRSTDSLGRATGGELHRSDLWAEILEPLGAGDGIWAAGIDRGVCWGRWAVQRSLGAPHFSAEEISLLDQVSTALAPALRALHAPATPADRIPPTGVAVVDSELRLVASDDAARAWFQGFPDAWLAQPASWLPMAVCAVAAAADGERGRARCRVRCSDGSWALLDARPLSGGETTTTGMSGAIAVTIGEPPAVELLRLRAAAAGLTPRELEVCLLLAEGADTAQLARALGVSPHTAKVHVRACFHKLEVGTRAELVWLLTGQRDGDYPDRGIADAG